MKFTTGSISSDFPTGKEPTFHSLTSLTQDSTLRKVALRSERGARQVWCGVWGFQWSYCRVIKGS